MGKVHALTRQLVKVRRADINVAGKAEVTPGDIIGNNHQEIGRGLFGLAGGQSGPDQPAGSLGLPIANVVGANPLDALNFIEGPQPLFDFNNGALYGNGIATITITAVPEPSTATLVLLGLTGASAAAMRRRLG